MAPARRLTRAAVTKNQQKLVAQRRTTKLAPVPKNAEATRTIEEKQADGELPASNTRVTHSRKRGWGVDEPLAFPRPPSLGTAVAQKGPNSKTGRETQLAESASIKVTLQKVKCCLGKVTE